MIKQFLFLGTVIITPLQASGLTYEGEPCVKIIDRDQGLMNLEFYDHINSYGIYQKACCYDTQKIWCNSLKKENIFETMNFREEPVLVYFHSCLEKISDITIYGDEELNLIFDNCSKDFFKSHFSFNSKSKIKNINIKILNCDNIKEYKVIKKFSKRPYYGWNIKIIN